MNGRVPSYLGQVLAEIGAPIGTCFQVRSGVLVTAWHVLDDLGCGYEGAEVLVNSLADDREPATATVVRTSPLHDLAVLIAAQPLRTSVKGLFATDRVELMTTVAVTGVPQVNDPGHDYGHLDAPGMWAGGTTRDNEVPLGRFTSSSVLPGMSGAPVRRLADDLVVGVVSARYNSTDGWLEHSVWVSRTEDLRQLLDGIADTVLDGALPLGDAVDLVLAAHASGVRLTGPHIDVSGASVRSGLITDALRDVLRRAESEHVPVRIGIDAPDLMALPWEATGVSGRPLALHPLVVLYRKVSAPAVRRIPGPLRIIVAISEPEGDERDYERELRNVLAAVRGARRGDADIRIVTFSTTDAIRAALAEAPAHVLHLSGAAHTDGLVVEHEDGTACTMTVDRFVDEAIPPGAMPPVVSLAAGRGDLCPVAHRLVRRGASVVIAARTSNPALFARIYQELARAYDIVAAVADARRAVEDWDSVVVLAGSGATRVFDPTDTADLPRHHIPSVAGLLSRDVGEFVGRRREQRALPAELNGPGCSGIVLHGIGGVGKTTLAAELVRRLDRPVVAVLSNELTVNGLLGQATSVLRRRGRLNGEQREAVRFAGDVGEPWQDRFTELREGVLGDLPLLVVLDNFEDNLDHQQIRDGALADLLAVWARDPGRSRLLVTSRYPFVLPGNAEHHLRFSTVGPLSMAETFKLIWALPALDRLEAREQERVWRLIGGHPRSLEYLDAVLNGGQARYHDVTARLAEAMRNRLGEPDVETLDAALAQTVTAIADDILLGDLLAQLADTPYAWQLLIGVSVYREPVDQVALRFQFRDPTTRLDTILDAHGVDITGIAELSDDVRDEVAELIGETLFDGVFNIIPNPPRSLPVDLDELVANLAATSLLSIGEDGTFFVHRWTATELDRCWREQGRANELTHAHARAADYWRARGFNSEKPETAARAWIEARHHMIQAGENEHVPEATKAIVHHLDVTGAWDQETALLHEMLGGLEPDSPNRAVWLHQLGNVMLQQGELDEAERRYREALDVAGDEHRAGCHHQLGMTAQQREDYDEAERQYALALSLKERQGEPESIAQTLNQMGSLALRRGDEAEADRLHARALAIREGAQDKTGLAKSYAHLATLAHERGNLDEAQRHARQSLELHKEMADQEGIAFNHLQLGLLAHARGNVEEAERHYAEATEGQRSHTLANTYQHIAGAAFHRDDFVTAEHYTALGLSLAEEMDDIPAIATRSTGLGVIATKQGRDEDAVGWHINAFSIRLEHDLPDVGLDLDILVRLRELLGADAFRTAASVVLDDESIEQLMAWLDDYAAGM